MASKGEFRYTTDEEGNLALERYGVRESDGDGKWLSVPMEAIEGRAMRGGKINPRNLNASIRGRENAKNTARADFTKGQEAVLRADEADNMSMVDFSFDLDELKQGNMPLRDRGKWSTLAGRETDKLLSGSADFLDTLIDIGQNLPPPLDIYPNVIGEPMEHYTGKTALERQWARKQEQKEKDELSQQLEDRAGLAQLSKAAPYLVTGGVGPAAGRVGGAAISKVTSGIDKGVRASGREAASLLDRIIEGNPNNPLGAFARKVDEDIAVPLRRGAVARANRPPKGNPYRKGAGGDALGSTALGGVEGGLHYDENIVEGALSSVLGNVSGKVAEPKLSRAVIERSDAEKEILDWASSKGYRSTPGTASGNRVYQKEEAGMRTDDKFSQTMHRFDDANDTVKTNVAGEAMGLTPQQMRHLTPESLKAHIDDLKGQYTNLQESSIGKVTLKDINALKSTVDNLPETKLGGRTRKDVNAMIDYIKTLGEPQRDKRGRFKAATFNGEQYQKTRSQLKNMADIAWDKNRDLYHILQDTIKVMDDGMYQGVKKHGGKATADQWRDLNERYAMTKLVMNQGMDPLGGINLNKLSENFSSNDMERMLLETGGRITDLHRLVKLNHLEKDRIGSGLSGSRVQGADETKSETARLLTTPAGTQPGPITEARTNMYLKGIPSLTGLLNLPREGQFTAPRILRSTAQGTDMQRETARKTEETRQDLSDMMSTGRDFTTDIFGNLYRWAMEDYETGESEEEKKKKSKSK